MSVFRIYVEKKKEFAVEANGVLADLKTVLQIKNLDGVRVLNRYDVEGISQEIFESAKATVFSEPQVDVIYDELPEANGELVFATEYLPGQFDQRADSCAQCISLLAACDQPTVKTARIFYLAGNLTDEDFAKIKAYLINPVESREASLDKYTSLKTNYTIPTEVATIDGFIGFSEAELSAFIKDNGLAMDLADILFCQKYFKDEEKRNPTITEIKMIDTYWSDHCRHTTFSTIIDDVTFESDCVLDTYNKYLELRKKLYVGRNKPITLMDIATIGAKALKANGMLTDLDESEEINACSVKINVDVNGKDEEWLLMFKNETHNHPTEIEPFGGAATCLGGAIRDPLSGRAYVYQAMRVTGCANPLADINDTLKGKLPQRKITTTAAAGYSSYGNQIGLATGHVAEIYHDGYVAKRMEIGAVMGAAPAQNVVRLVPSPDDVIILLGGATGRDGCGGATGSSKSHTVCSLESCGAEVQKGNAPVERKIQRLFRNPAVTKMIKRCNDFGAGGVSVAIGELADGLLVNLNAVPKKYDGLDGTELAISESQERMAVVVAPENVDKFVEYASAENLDATIVAKVTEQKRLRLTWNDKFIVDLSREFLNSNGADKHTTVKVAKQEMYSFSPKGETFAQKVENLASDLNICSQKGLVERFDSTIGSNTVLMPFGGKNQLTPTQTMVAKIPVLDGKTNTVSCMAWGFNPYVSEKSPYLSAMYAVIESVAKIIAAGGSYKKAWLTFQEYFEKIGTDSTRWGKVFSALLGALESQLNLGIAAIGGKDSMSGTFEDINVPPTLVSFAVSAAKAWNIISPEFKKAGSKVCVITPSKNADGTADFDSVRDVFDKVEKLIADKKVLSAWAISFGGVLEGVFKMALGNEIGMSFDSTLADDMLFGNNYGGFVLEMADDTEVGTVIGKTTAEYELAMGNDVVSLADIQSKWEAKLAPVFPYRTKVEEKSCVLPAVTATSYKAPAIKCQKPKVLIPVFPGTNCEYDTARAFEDEGCEADIFVIKNLTSADITESINAFEQKIMGSQIIAVPGGFSGGDEPDGSAKFITSFFRNPKIKDAVSELLKNRDGLMLGICNGFQALIKLGLVTYGEIVDATPDSPTLTFNTIGRHQSMMVRTNIVSNKSPWLMHTKPGDSHLIAISHGEGRFIANDEWIKKLVENGQVATQYINLEGVPTYDSAFNPNNSVYAIEGITSPDGRVLGKMGHSERFGKDIVKNIEGNKDQQIFKAAFDYFNL